ncbi:MAG TPA: LD-carboxypeptidase [Candidatus Acidoferrales bacterium]|nr:LD-carboxypeptidase [Candidatus Acidoferrales bacterium]
MLEPLKPPALRADDQIRVLALASPVEEDHLRKGCDELSALGFTPTFDPEKVLARDGFFAGPTIDRVASLREALAEPATRAIFCARGGYGSNYLVDCLSAAPVAPSAPKILLGASDITSLQIYLWQKFRWVTFYGPMVSMNFDRGAGAPHGYDRASLLSALTEATRGWTLNLRGESIVSGIAEGVLLGGCLTLVESTLGTPWEIDTAGAVLALEDRGMKPYQVDRALMHLKQAGKLQSVRGIILGDFPDSEGPAGTETVRDVVRRILLPLRDKQGGFPIIWGAPIGHTARPMLTLPLGVYARMTAAAGGSGSTKLEILEPACVA